MTKSKSTSANAAHASATSSSSPPSVYDDLDNDIEYYDAEMMGSVSVIYISFYLFG